MLIAIDHAYCLYGLSYSRCSIPLVNGIERIDLSVQNVYLLRLATCQLSFTVFRCLLLNFDGNHTTAINTIMYCVIICTVSCKTDHLIIVVSIYLSFSPISLSPFVFLAFYQLLLDIV